MEGDTITTLTTIADLASKGGSVATGIAVYIAFRAGQTAKNAVSALVDAAKTLNDIHELMIDGKVTVDRMDVRAAATESAVAVMNMKLSALLSNRFGVPEVGAK